MVCKTKYLIVKGSGGGGLGDRIRSVLTGIAYAKLTNRTIYIDWSDGKLIPDKRNIFYENFELNNLNHTSHCPVSDDVYPPVWKNALDNSLHDLYLKLDLCGWNRQTAIERFSFNQGNLDYSQTVLVMWEFDQLNKILHHYPHNTELGLLQHLANEHLHVAKRIENKVSQYKQVSLPTGSETIAVHIRATDEFRNQKSGVGLKDYCAQIRRFIRAVNTDVKIFLATDNNEVEKQIFDEFPKQVVIRNKWFAAAGDKIHFNDQCPDPEKALEDAIIEICLLAQSDYLIYQHNSSFGMVAHFLCNADHSQIAALVPDSGFKSRIKQKIKHALGR